ncbi:MAG TPA: hypothetical protein VIS09_16615 [Streptomyces sp.]
MDSFAERLDCGWNRVEAAIGEAQDGRWVRNAVERLVIKDAGCATDALHGGRSAPFGQDSWHVRIASDRAVGWGG